MSRPRSARTKVPPARPDLEGSFEFDVAYTSELKKAQQTLKLVMDITGQNDHAPSWRLNERMYGASRPQQEGDAEHGC